MGIDISLIRCSPNIFGKTSAFYIIFNIFLQKTLPSRQLGKKENTFSFTIIKRNNVLYRIGRYAILNVTFIVRVY